MKFNISDDVIHQPVQEEVVLLNLKSQQYYSLDDVGSRMWNLLLEHRDIDIVSSILLREYKVDSDRLRTDVEALVAQLAQAGILVISST
jgi:hypothetical protein